MTNFVRDRSADAKQIPFGAVLVRYPDLSCWQTDRLARLARRTAECIRRRSRDYDRKTKFAGNLYVRFFKKFKKTYPLVFQYESIALKGRSFAMENPAAAVAFIAEMSTLMLSGAHDADRLEGDVTLFCPDEKIPFSGLTGAGLHTYPGDFCARDSGGIVFSLIAGADGRSAVSEKSRNVIYPVFGVPGMDCRRLRPAMEQLAFCARTLAPGAVAEMNFF